MTITKSQYTKVLELFTAPDGKKVEDYHTQSILEYETTGQWSIKLGYGYNKAGKQIIYGGAVKFATMELAQQVQTLLHKFKQERKNIVIENLDFLTDDISSPEPRKKLAHTHVPDVPVVEKSTEEAQCPFSDNKESVEGSYP